MKTKEAIEYINKFDIICNPTRGKNLDEVIALLQQGEKYRLMWEEFFNTIYPKQMKLFLPIKSIIYPNNKNEYSLTTLEGLKSDIEQKYFPEEESQDYKEGEE